MRAIEQRRTPSPTLELVPELDVPVVPGDVVGGRYVVDGMLAAGGMGVVCLATHIDLQQRVAIKFLREAFAKNESLVQRFLNEARAAAVLKSDNVVRVIDVGQLDGGRPYLVMEHLEGEDLEALAMREGPFDVDRAVRYTLEVCNALAEAHACAIVHRDIKPENLFLAATGIGRHTVKVVDFGLAKRIDTTPVVVTGPQDSMGSPCYMSPEQITTPQNVDARTDIWSLGVVLYRLLTVTMPFDGATVMEVYARVLNAQPKPLRSVRPELDRGIEAIVDRCLQKDPARRYQTIGELAAALTTYQASRGGTDFVPGPISVRATPVSVCTPAATVIPEVVFSTPPPKRKGPRLFTVAAITLIASFCGAWSVRDDHTRTEARAVVKAYVDLAIPRTTGQVRTALEQADVLLTPVELPPDPVVPGLAYRYSPPAQVAGGVASRHPVLGRDGQLTLSAERELNDVTAAPVAGMSVPAAVPSAPVDVDQETYSDVADAARQQQEAYQRSLESQRTVEAPEARPSPTTPETEPLKPPPVQPDPPKPSVDDLKTPAL
jgi:serine/threonine-protein kinase